MGDGWTKGGGVMGVMVGLGSVHCEAFFVWRFVGFFAVGRGGGGGGRGGGGEGGEGKGGRDGGVETGEMRGEGKCEGRGGEGREGNMSGGGKGRAVYGV